MIKKLKNYIVAAAMVLAAGAPVVLTTNALAANAIQDSLCNGTSIATTGSSGTCNSSGTDATTKITDIAKQVINILSIVVGVAAVIMIIVGGFKYITSGGDSNKVGGAKNTIIYAIIGLVLVALAQLIVNVVLTKTTSISS